MEGEIKWLINRERKIVLRVMVTEQENKNIKNKMLQVGTKNFSLYARKMLIDGYILKLDLSVIKSYIYEIGKIGVNINQIAKNANRYNYTSKDNIQMIIKTQSEIKSQLNKIMNILKDI